MSKHSAPPFPACLPASYNRDLVDDVGPMIGLLQRVREGESPVQEFTSMCNDVFSKSLAILGLLDSLYVPVTRTETEQLFAHPQGLIRAIRTSHGVVAWAYNKPFRGTSGVVSQEALYKARIDPMHRNTIEDYCRRCASLRAMNMSAAVKVIAAPQPHSTALVCIALGFIYSICTQFYADVVNKRIVWASMYVKRDGELQGTKSPGNAMPLAPAWLTLVYRQALPVRADQPPPGRFRKAGGTRPDEEECRVQA